MEYLRAFLVGGLLCVIGQILIDRTKLTPARILTGYVTAGVFLTAVGLYDPLVEWAGCGATVPLTGFGYTLAKGVEKAVGESGLLGVFSGGGTACAAGVGAAIFFSLLRQFNCCLCAVGTCTGNDGNTFCHCIYRELDNLRMFLF